MKTTVITIAAIIGLALGTVNVSKAATVKTNETAIILKDVSKINNIEVHGNVEVFVSDGTADQVKVYNQYYAENALVQSQNGTLRISSYKTEKLVVWVTANELNSISAYDNAQVKSFGKLAQISLDVNLFDSSSADLDLGGYSASINLNGHAKANLSGLVTRCDLVYTTSSTVNKVNFTVEQLYSTVKNDRPAVKNELDALATL